MFWYNTLLWFWNYCTKKEAITFRISSFKAYRSDFSEVSHIFAEGCRCAKSPSYLGAAIHLLTSQRKTKSNFQSANYWSHLPNIKQPANGPKCVNSPTKLWFLGVFNIRGKGLVVQQQLYICWHVSPLERTVTHKCALLGSIHSL